MKYIRTKDGVYELGIDEELKALEIIKNKDVHTVILKHSISKDDYNQKISMIVTKKRAKTMSLTQEEYDLLKEVLL